MGDPMSHSEDRIERHGKVLRGRPRKPPVPPPTAQMRKLRAAKWSYAQIARVVGLTTPEVAAMFGEANPMSFRTAGAP